MSEKIGIDLKNLIKLVSKVKKKRRKNKKSKKRKLDQINNNKPNFGHQNQIGGGGGGVGGTSSNPFNQPRLTPTVTTVLSAPNGSNDNSKSSENSVKIDWLRSDIGKGFNYINNGVDDLSKALVKEIEGGLNKINSGYMIKDASKKSPDRIEEADYDSESDNIGFNNASSHNPLSDPVSLYKLKQNTNKIRTLSNQSSVNFRNPVQSSGSRFGNSPINGDGTQNIYNDLSEPSYHSSDNHISDGTLENQQQSEESEPLNNADVTQTDTTDFGYTEVLPDIQNDNSINNNVPIPSLIDTNIDSNIDSKPESAKTLGYSNYDVNSQKDIWDSDADNTMNKFREYNNKKQQDVESAKKQYYDDENEDSESWRERDKLDVQKAREDKLRKEQEIEQEKQKKALEKEEKKKIKEQEQEMKKIEYAKKMEQGIKPKGRAPFGWQNYKQEDQKQDLEDDNPYLTAKRNAEKRAQELIKAGEENTNEIFKGLKNAKIIEHKYNTRSKIKFDNIPELSKDFKF